MEVNPKLVNQTSEVNKEPEEPQCSPSPDRIELLKKRMSGWLRQSRYRSRRAGIDVDIDFPDIVQIYEDTKYCCAYCGKIADSPEHPFPIHERGPCVAANVLPCCNECRSLKKNRSLIRFYQDGHISEEKMHELLKTMIKRKGGKQVKDHIRATYVPNGQDNQDNS